MISPRTRGLVAATVIAFVASRVISPAVTQTWDLSEGGRPRQAWAMMAEFCAVAAVISVVVDFILNRRKPT